MKKQLNGFTLVELLISIALGAAILLATTQLFVEGRDSFQYQSQWRELHERGRHLMQFLTTELQRSGYPKEGFSGTALNGSDGDGVNSHDTLTIGYQDGEDCTGSSSDSTQYYMDENDLRCDGDSASPQTLTSHIDGLQFRYGIDSDADGSLDRYLTASSITDWSQVKAVTVALLLRSEHEVRQEQDDAIHSLLETDYGPFNDYYLRKTYQATVQLRNH